MSLFDITDATRRRWLADQAVGLGRVTDLMLRKALPTLTWTVTEYQVAGKVNTLRGDDPREQFEAWFAALTDYPRSSPGKLGLARNEDHRYERTDDGGRTYMAAAFEVPLTGHTRHPYARVVLIAEWWAEDRELEGAEAGGR